MIIVSIIFWGAIAILVHVFFLYPILLWVISKFYKLNIEKNLSYQPSVSILISAYNEEECIGKKLKNLLSQNYPLDKIEIIVVSDGSTDATNEIAAGFATQYKNIHFINLKKNQGKTVAMNRAVAASNHDYLLFTDADNVFSENVTREIMSNFYDDTIGCVCGKLIFYSDKETRAATAGGFYWKYNQFLRTLESKTGSTMGANGAIFAVRRKLFNPLAAFLIDDFSTSMSALFNGYRIVFEDKAHVYSKHTTEIVDENKRRKRIGNRVCTAIFYFWDQVKRLDLFNLFKFLSHKLFRYYALFFMVVAFLTNLMLFSYSQVYTQLLVLQIMFYSFAFLGFMLNRTNRSPKVFYLPYYFFIMNFYQFVGAVNSIAGRRYITWDTSNSSR